jgi:3-oxoacyl-[acyl-carrier protein] reductase
MDLSLEGRVAFVAGSSRGIGRACVARLAAEGASVAVTGRTPGAVEEAVATLTGGGNAATVLGWSGDLSTVAGIGDALGATMERFGRLDVLVSCIGDGRGRPGWEHGDRAWAETFEKNLWPSVRLCEQAVPLLTGAGAAIVLVGSIAGRERLGPLPYGTAKAALAAYATRLAEQVATLGIRVVCVEPGNVLVSGGRWEERLVTEPDAVTAMLERDVLLRRLASPEEVADVICFLASSRASFMTATRVVVDGGQTRD